MKIKNILFKIFTINPGGIVGNILKKYCYMINQKELLASTGTFRMFKLTHPDGTLITKREKGAHEAWRPMDGVECPIFNIHWK